MALNESPEKSHEVGVEQTEEASNKVKVTSRELIKPSSPTPTENKTVLFSLIDQIAGSQHISLVLFYQNDPDNASTDSIEATNNLLKKSLSETLVAFYPLAGRIVQNKMIECDDQGAEFCEAQVSQNLLDYIKNPSIEDLNSLLPFQGTPLHQNLVLSAQVNHFACGGSAISVCVSHKIADFTALFDFINAWATKARLGDDGVLIGSRMFKGGDVFRGAKELEETKLAVESEDALLNQERMEMKRLTFDKKMIDELKAEAEAGGVARPTRVEVVTAFLWKHLPPNFCNILQVVNLRKRIEPPMPEDFFGNCAWLTRTSSIDGPNNHPHLVVAEFRKAIDKISHNYMQDFIVASSDNIMLKLKEETDALFQGVGEFFLCNSFSGYPLYAINFGMGDPVWVSPAGKPCKNALLTVTTKCGHGIEALICLLQPDMAAFESSVSHYFPPHHFKTVPIARLI
ncbi:hypothetical protein vseg_010444 [Gypsophila vaccaria]